ncbi:hypothetical protein QE152_g5255 [Popillia japonica]|uniref:Uncharacterized protein n=1 Tax=Popillia japonica TaxID=7064 RepID=A0AAW1MQ79_POPJA
MDGLGKRDRIQSLKECEECHCFYEDTKYFLHLRKWDFETSFAVKIEMGGKSSKTEGLLRTASFRRSQKNTLQKIEKKLDRTSKDINNFRGSIDDNKYTKIKQNITDVIDDLEKINPTVKDKHKETYQKILDKCNDELQKLDAKVTNSPSLSPVVSPVASPTPISPANIAATPLDSPLSERSSHSVQVKLVKVSLEEQMQQPPR